MDSAVLLAIDQHIATLTLNRPAVMNVLDESMAVALREHCAELARQTDVRCVVIRGAGGHFMAGGDISYFAQSLPLPAEERHRQVTGIIRVVHEAIQSIRAMPKPVLASASGAVAGFGVSLLAACDLAVVADDLRLASAYCQLGVSPDGGNTFFLPRSIGEKRAKAMTFLGEPIDAATALGMGLVNEVVPLADLPAHTLRLAQRLVAMPAQAIASSKRLLNDSLDHCLEQQLVAEQRSFADCTLTGDFAEGVRAFLAKRPPRFNTSPGLSNPTPPAPEEKA